MLDRLRRPADRGRHDRPAHPHDLQQHPAQRLRPHGRHHDHIGGAVEGKQLGLRQHAQGAEIRPRRDRQVSLPREREADARHRGGDAVERVQQHRRSLADRELARVEDQGRGPHAETVPRRPGLRVRRHRNRRRKIRHHAAARAQQPGRVHVQDAPAHADQSIHPLHRLLPQPVVDPRDDRGGAYPLAPQRTGGRRVVRQVIGQALAEVLHDRAVEALPRLEHRAVAERTHKSHVPDGRQHRAAEAPTREPAAHQGRLALGVDDPGVGRAGRAAHVPGEVEMEERVAVREEARLALPRPELHRKRHADDRGPVAVLARRRPVVGRDHRHAMAPPHERGRPGGGAPLGAPGREGRIVLGSEQDRRHGVRATNSMNGETPESR